MANNNTDSATPISAEELEALLGETRVPAVSIAVIRGGELVWSTASGVLDHITRQPAVPDTIFAAMSLSKPVFAYAVMLLRQQAKLDLDTPLTGYLPSAYIENEPQLGQITARTVLSHQTGLPNWRPKGERLRFLRPPNRQFGYSGEGFVYLQRVVERISGLPLDDYIKQHVFDPLGMIDSSFIRRGSDADRTAIAYSADGTPAPERDFTKPNAASSLHTTAADYARFLLALAGVGDPPLRPEFVDEMCTPRIGIGDDLAWSLGCGIERSDAGDAIWHWGSDDGAATFFALDRATRTGCVILTNSGNGRALYKPLIYRLLPGEHPSLEVESNPEWLRLIEAQG